VTEAAGALVRAVSLALPKRGRLALSVLLGVLAIGSAIGLLATSGYLISRASEQPQILTLTVAIVAVRFFGVARAVCRYLERLVSHGLAFQVLAELRSRFYERLVPLAPSALRRTRSADLLSRFVADVDSLQHVFLRGLAPPVVAVGTIGIAVGVAWLILPAAAAVLAAILVLATIALPVLAGLVARASGRRVAPARADLTGELVELLQGAPELVVYGQEALAIDRVEAADVRLARLARRDAAIAGLTTGLTTFLTGAAVAGVLLVSVPKVSEGTLDGVLVAVLALLALAAFEAVVPLALAAQHLTGAAGAARRLEDVTGSTAVVREPASPRAIPAQAALALEGARFRYEADGPWVLDVVDLRLAPGRRIALVGPSGSGKSTIAHALVRFIDLDEGRATLGGHDLSTYAQADVRSVVRLAGQDAHLFATTIRENVRLARPESTDAEVLAALHRAGLRDWIASLPAGLDTPVGEDGSQVSGGQRQRIALGRALLADAEILVLDEPTAQLDEGTARAFLDDLLATTDGTGVLLITHRLSGLDRFDEILVLDEGRIVERGTHAALLEQGGRYRAALEAERADS
jgi:thiol reductant ABC exporter CydC subunit